MPLELDGGVCCISKCSMASTKGAFWRVFPVIGCVTCGPVDRSTGRAHFELVIGLLLLVQTGNVLAVHCGLQGGLLAGSATQRGQVL